MYGASEAANFSLLWHATGVALTVAQGRDPRSLLRLSTLLTVESLAVNQGVKRLFERPRPEQDPLERRLRLRQPSTSSFPSGHASAATVAAGVLSEMDPARKPLWWSMAAVVATSRLHVRIHHASDVMAGALVGTAIGVGLRRLWPPRVSEVDG